jgi:hypothetical protein
VFCPKCRDEFIEGITECPDCKVPLVNDLSVEEGPTYDPIYVDLVTVVESGAPGLIVYRCSTILLPPMVMPSKTTFVSDNVNVLPSIALLL